MINVTGIAVKYGDRVLLQNINLVFKKGERIGLIGRNGAGKSTLLKIIAGIIKSDSGDITLPTGNTIGYLKQEIDFENDRSILDETLECFEELKRLEVRILEINVELEEREDYESDDYLSLVSDLSVTTERIAILDSGNIEGDTIKILKGLGFKEKDLQNSITTLSGGWKMRVELAKLLLTQPDLLLLDEPTNHLDIESIIWLENYLVSYPGTVILISHDTQFLDNTVNRVIEIELGKTIDIKGNYQHFLVEKDKQKEILESAFVNQQKVIEQREKTINRFMAKATKTSMAQSMKKQLDKMERIVIPNEDKSELRLQFSEVPRSSLVMFKARNLKKSFGENHVIKGVNLQVERGDKIAFVGQNGQGKSTLAKILTGDMQADNGAIDKGENIYMSYYAQNETDLIQSNKTVLEIAEDHAPPEYRTKVRNVLGSFLFSGEDVEKKVSILSGGEKSRLALACKIMHPANLIILDEPTNHLDINAKNILKDALKKYTGALIVVSHDRHFLSDLTDKVFEFRDNDIKEYLGDINYYLKKRKVDDIREIEKSENVETPVKKVKVIDRSLKKEIEKKIRYKERDINKLEETVTKMNLLMTQVTDFASPEFIKLSKDLSDTQDALKKKEQEWEILVTQLEE